MLLISFAELQQEVARRITSTSMLEKRPRSRILKPTFLAAQLHDLLEDAELRSQLQLDALSRLSAQGCSIQEKC